MANVVVECEFLFGLRSGVSNNLCFSDEQTVVFPSGNNFVCYNTAHKSQRLISVSEESQSVRTLTISANRRYLAVSECKERPTIVVFDLLQEQDKKRKFLTAKDVTSGPFISLAFSPDSKCLLGQSDEPEGLLVLWQWEKQKVLATVQTSSLTNPVTQVCFSPYNNTQLSVSGNGVFKLFRNTNGVLKQINNPKVENVNFLCHAWITEERVIASTDSDRLVLFVCGEARREINTYETAEGQANRQVERKQIRGEAGRTPRKSSITAIVPLSDGFACSPAPGLVCLYKNTDKDEYRKYREIWIPSFQKTEITEEHCHEVGCMCTSPAEGTLAISTTQGQLYCVSLSSVINSKRERVYFDQLSQPCHSKAITDLSVCMWKPLVATSSLDCSICIWNYEAKELIVCKKFQEEPQSLSLHPTGLFILVGFTDKLRLMEVLMDDLRTLKEFTVRGSKRCAFSHGGHMFAALNGNLIELFSFTSFGKLISLKGHNKKVCAIDWSQDDSRLVSCGTDGAVYEWNTQTGKRESACILKSCSYTDVAFSSNGETILAVGTDLTLKEIQACQILKEVPADDVALTAVAMSRSGRVVFSGTSAGAIRAIKYPLPMQKDWAEYQSHCAPVTRMRITFDDQFLLAVSADNSVSMWRIVDPDGQKPTKSISQTLHFDEVLVNQSDLLESIQEKSSLEEVQMENEYQLRLKDIHYNEKIKELTDSSALQSEALLKSLQVMRSEMEKHSSETRQRSAEEAAQHSMELKDLEISYSEKLIVEQEKYQELQCKYEQMQEDYERQLKAAATDKSSALEELTQVYEALLLKKNQLLDQRQEDAEQQSREFKEHIKQVEEDENRMVHDIQTAYDRKLHFEKETNMKLIGEASIVKQKVFHLQREIQDKCTEIFQLKQEQQKFQGLISNLDTDIISLKRKISEYEKTKPDQEHVISELKKKNQQLEKMRFHLDSQVNEMKKQAKPQQEIIREKERTQQLEEELMQMNKSNTQLKLCVSELKLKLRTKEQEVDKEKLKMKELLVHLQRLKSDLHTCGSFIQEPKKLKETFKQILAQYVQPGDELKNSELSDLQSAFCRQSEHLERTVTALQSRLAKAEEEHEKKQVKLMKEISILVSQINELRIEKRQRKQ
ncbi:cilia- and flagella-associated protein 57 isoform X1 [Synchiropus splendidus]|uniref:cilia- and flagella-associated protein 57 isoform X1 n=1 Tax=Synchiropus splendidus TaxID=270530 RepID=UPI00237ED6E8|nr:cilia- and flagella-associated protein 57 isoform X1 [Synchiropus splendidus]